MSGISIDISVKWEKQDTDMSVCSVCTEVIYSPMYVMCVSANALVTQTDKKLCESCYSEMIKR